jgi:hypothetical protein
MLYNGYMLAPKFLVLFISISISATLAQAQNPVQQTSALLNNKVERDKVISKDSNAGKADQQVQSLGLDPKGQEEVYQLSSKIFESLAAQSEGDPNKMMEKVAGYMKNPASLEKDLTTDEKSKIHELSLQMPGATHSSVRP